MRAHLQTLSCLISLLPALVSCNAPLLQSSPGGDDRPGSLSTQSQGLGSGGDSGGEDGESPADIPLAPLVCPEQDEKATLEFGHDVSWGVPGSFDINVKADGLILFNLVRSIDTHATGTPVGIHVVQPGPVTANVTATVEDCVQGYKSTITFVPTIYGTCVDGAFNLTIKEEWKDPKLSIICENDDVVEIPLPFGTQVHQVSGSIGEIASAEKPFKFKFAGIGGRGDWLYRISYWYTP